MSQMFEEIINEYISKSSGLARSMLHFGKICNHNLN